MRTLNLFLFSMIILGLFSCKSIGEASETIDEFYSLQSQGKYEEMIKYIHPKLLNKFGKEYVVNLFKKKANVIGKQYDYKQTGRGVRTSNGTTLIGLYYDCYGDKRTCYDYLVLQKVKDKFMVITYHFNVNKDLLPEFTPPKPGIDTEKNMKAFYKLQGQGRYNNMLAFMHDDMIKEFSKDTILHYLNWKTQTIGRQISCKKFGSKFERTVGKTKYLGFYYECVGDKGTV